MKHILTFAIVLAACLVSTDALASSGTVNTEDTPAGIVSMHDAYSSAAMTKADLRAAKKADKAALKAEKKQIRMEKRAAKFNALIQKVMAKKGLGGFDDPVDKWVWYAIIAGAAAIIFWIVWWPLGTAFFIAGVVFMVIWALKKWG